MKILYHHRTQGKGVEGVHIRGMIDAFRSLGHQVRVVSPPGIVSTDTSEKKYSKPSNLAKIWKWLSKNLPEVFFELLECAYNIWAYFKMKRIAQKEKFDFIYERYSFFCWAGSSLAKRYNIPIILEVNEISGIQRQRKQILVVLAKKIEKKIFENVDAIFTVSSFLKKEIIKREIDPEKVYVLPNAVNIEEFNLNVSGFNIREKLGLNGKNVLTFIGHFSRWDKLEFLIESFCDISKEREDAHLVIVGDGTGVGALEKAIQAKGLENKVSLVGRVKRKEIPEYIAATDICIIPHSNSFGSPVVLFEYMAMAKPVVAPKLCPIEEVIRHNYNGILFTPGDKESLKQAILDLMQQKQKKESIGKQAYDLVLNKHLWTNNARQVLEVYHHFRDRNRIKEELEFEKKDIPRKIFLGGKFGSSLQTIQHKFAYKWVTNTCESILEIGCSSGYFTNLLRQKAKKVYGVDINKTHIDRAKVNYPDIEFRAIDATELPFGDRMFDAVIMLEVFEHIEDREKLIHEIYRVLKTNGILILSTPNTGLFQFLDPFNLKVIFKREFPNLTKVLSTKVQKYQNTQFRDNLFWHNHYSLEVLERFFKGKLAIEKVHRGGLLVFPLCSLLQSILTRIIPVRSLFAVMQRFMNLDGSLTYGKWAYNLVVQARKV